MKNNIANYISWPAYMYKLVMPLLLIGQLFRQQPGGFFVSSILAVTDSQADSWKVTYVSMLLK